MLKRSKFHRLARGVFLFSIFVFGVQLIFGLFFETPSFSTPVSERMKRSINQVGKFEVAYPENWFFLDTLNDRTGDGSQLVYISHPSLVPLRTGPWINILKSKSPFHALSEVASWGEATAERRQRFPATSATANRTVFSKEFNAGNERTIQREYTLELNGSFGMPVATHCIDDYRFHDEFGYVLTLCADEIEFDRLSPTFQRIIESFTFRN